MFDWVPLQNYTYYFDLSILILIMLVLWQCRVGSVLKKDTASLNATWGFIFAIVLILYMGLRPINIQFGDTVNYASEFRMIQEGRNRWGMENEWLFSALFHWFARNSNIHAFFLLCSVFYVGSLWLAMQRMFKDYYYIPFLIILSMFTFWSYGVNGVRNGVGASLFILALSYANNIPLMCLLAFIGTGFHTSVFMMIGAGIIAWFLNNSYLYLVIWVVSIGASYVAGGTIQDFLANIPFFSFDDRFQGYLTQETDEANMVYVSGAFRWDFIAYSSLGTLIGYYFIFRRDFKDEYYHWIYNIYLITNAFWILVIRAAFSNRFAQISWFILPVVLIYPFMKKRFWTNHEKYLAYAIMLFYAYTFYENFIRTGRYFRMF